MTRQARTQYVVVAHEGRWHVRRHGKLFGPFPSQAIATCKAVDVAQASSLNDRPSQVLTEEAGGACRVEWTFGDHPYPPSG